MKRGRQALVALVLLSSGVPLVQVLYDRSSAPRQMLTLSHREMMMGWNRDENSGETLGWSWATPPELDSVSAQELAALRISCQDESYTCRTGSGRRGWMVVELDYARWQGAIDSLKARIDSTRSIVPSDSLTDRTLRELVGRMEQLVLRTSRLRMVAVGRDPTALAAQWNDSTHLVLPARFTAYRNVWPRDSLDRREPNYRLHAEPVPSVLYVPARWTDALADTLGTRQQMFEVEVVVGQRWLPRVTLVEKLPDPKLPIDTSPR